MVRTRCGTRCLTHTEHIVSQSVTRQLLEFLWWASLYADVTHSQPRVGYKVIQNTDAEKLWLVAHLCKPAPEAEAEHHQALKAALTRVRACFKPRAGGWWDGAAGKGTCQPEFDHWYLQHREWEHPQTRAVAHVCPPHNKWIKCNNNINNNNNQKGAWLNDQRH